MSIEIKRLETSDPRMSQVVIRNGIVYMSGQVDEVETDVEGQTKAILGKGTKDAFFYLME
jgi:enamine deaminase RidA (YjgF/YER057c/UK114 family)